MGVSEGPVESGKPEKVTKSRKRGQAPRNPSRFAKRHLSKEAPALSWRLGDGTLPSGADWNRPASSSRFFWKL